MNESLSVSDINHLWARVAPRVERASEQALRRAERMLTEPPHNQNRSWTVVLAAALLLVVSKQQTGEDHKDGTSRPCGLLKFFDWFN